MLLVSGRYDFKFPPEVAQKPLIRWTGTASEDKRLEQFDTGHMPPVDDVIRSALTGWINIRDR